jgi:hypothetical protein
MPAGSDLPFCSLDAPFIRVVDGVFVSIAIILILFGSDFL